MNTSAVMDVLLRLLTTIENNELKQRVLKWLTDIDLIKNLISLFSHKFTTDVHSNVSQLLCDIIRISREQILAQRENQRDAASYNLTINNSYDYTSSNMMDGQNMQQNDYIFINPLLDTLETYVVCDFLTFLIKIYLFLSVEVVDKLLDCLSRLMLTICRCHVGLMFY